MHLCWGNYEGPHHCDVPLSDIVDVVFKAKPMALSLEGRQSASRARICGVRNATKLPNGKVFWIPGVLESKSNFILEGILKVIANRISNYAKLVGRENVIAGSDCGYGTWVGQAVPVEPGHCLGEIRGASRRRSHRQQAVLAVEFRTPPLHRPRSRLPAGQASQPELPLSGSG